MSTVFRPSSEADLDAIMRLFRNVFRPKEDSPLLNRQQLRWKYYEPRPDWNGSRSFVMERAGEIVAHGCAWPVEVLTERARIRGVHLADWAGDPAAPLTGISLLKRIEAQADFICTIGGSHVTRALLPRIGFSRANDMDIYVRPLRPLAQFRAHQHRDVKLPLRLARNAYWRWVPRLRKPAGWHARAVDTSDLSTLPRPKVTDQRFSFCRAPEIKEYLDKSPLVRFQWYRVTQGSGVRGCFCLANVYRQARVVDLWIEGATRDDYQAAHTLASLMALEDTDAAEIIATSCWSECALGLEDSGFHHVESEPIHLSGTLAPHLLTMPLDAHLADGDLALLHDGRASFLS